MNIYVHVCITFMLYLHTSFCTGSNFDGYPEAISYYSLPRLDIQIVTNYSYVYKDPTISENCTQAAEVFTENVTNLTRCTSVNARPIRACMNCLREKEATSISYDKLQKVSPECLQFYFGSDQIGIITLIYTQGEDIWARSNCQNCYDHIEDAKKFLRLSKKLDKCIQGSNESSLHGQNGTCDLCHDLFEQMNDIYNLFLKNVSLDEVSGVCMDIVDQMNITRQMWHKHNCVKFDSSIGYPNIITAVFVGTMPIFFYLLSKNISIIEDVKLVRPKRKGFISSSMPTE